VHELKPKSKPPQTRGHLAMSFYMTFADQLQASCELLSHWPISPTQTSSHLYKSHHAHTTFSLYLHSDILKPQLCSSSAIIIPHVSCNSPTHILHLKYNSSHILLCCNSNPALIHYAHVTLSPLHLHDHWPDNPIITDIAVLCSSIKWPHVCIWHVQISTSITTTINLSNFHPLNWLVCLCHDLQPPTHDLQTLNTRSLALHSILCSPLYWHSNLELNSNVPQNLPDLGLQLLALYKILRPL